MKSHRKNQLLRTESTEDVESFAENNDKKKSLFGKSV
jgi:hypothetical protein